MKSLKYSLNKFSEDFMEERNQPPSQERSFEDAHDNVRLQKFLPTGWDSVRLGDALTLINGRAFKPSEWRESGVPIVRIQNLNDPDAPFNYYEGSLPDKFLLKSGDLLFAWSGTPGTSFGAHIWHGKKAWLNQHIFKVSFDESNFDKRFLRLAINQNLNEYIRQAHGGAGLAHITKGKFENSVLPNPSLDEQKRIVSEIEKQFSRLDEAVAGLKRIKANLKRYKAAVLKAAVEGNLTEEWRNAHPNVESGTALLKRILAERKKKWEEKNPGKKYKEPAAPNTSDLPKLPKGWVWATVEQLADVGTGATPLRSKHQYYDGGSIPWVTSSALNNEFISEAEEHITDLAMQETNVKLFPIHTLLIAMYGEGKTRGKVSELLLAAATNQACAAIVLEGLSARQRKYVKLFLLKNYDDIRRLSSGGVQPNLNLSHIKSTSISLPPIPEQQVIVEAVESLLSVAEENEAALDINLKRAERLRQGILKKAFSGQLTR